MYPGGFQEARWYPVHPCGFIRLELTYTYVHFVWGDGIIQDRNVGHVFGSVVLYTRSIILVQE